MLVKHGKTLKGLNINIMVEEGKSGLPLSHLMGEQSVSALELYKKKRESLSKSV